MTRHALTFAACALTLVVSCRTGRAADHAVETPAHAKAWSRGNCLIIESRTGNKPVATVDWADADCDKNVQGDIGGAFAWLPDFLNRALDYSEVLACGQARCALPKETVRIYVTWGLAPQLEVRRGRNSFVRVWMTTALIQSAEATVTTYLDELRAQDAGGPAPFSDWLKAIDAKAGQACTPVDVPRRQLNDEDFMNLRKAAQTFYTFIFTHEMAHQLLGDDCKAGTDSDALTQETACDRFAFDAMTRQPVLVPSLGFVAPAVVFAHYQLALDPQLGRLGAAGAGTFSEQFPAARWSERATAIVNRWDAYCRGGAQNAATCMPGWKTVLADARRIVALPLPRSCGAAGQAPAAASADPAAARCLTRILGVDANDEDIQWITDGDPPIARLRLRYQNLCPRPLRCSARVMLGTVLKASGDDASWQPYSSADLAFEVPARQIHELHATLNWTTSPGRMPRLRLPTPPRNMELLACQYSGPSVAVAPSTDPFCTRLRALVDRVNDLPSLAAPAGTDKSGRYWSLDAILDGAESCSAYKSGWVSCAMRINAGLVFEPAFDDLARRVTACLSDAAPRQTPEEPGHRTTQLRFAGRREYVEVSGSRDEDGSPLSLDIGVHAH